MRAVALVLSLAVAANASPLTDRASPRTVPTSTGWTSRSLNLDIPVERDISDPSDKAKRQSWTFTQPGTTGVLAMMMAVVSPTQLLIIDRTAHNPLQVDGHNAWAAVYSLTSNSARPVRVQTNSFCAGGAWLSNGTLANIGGFRAEMADIPDENGLQAVRHWYPEQCPDSGTAPCAFVEYPNRVRLGAPRWYPSVARVGDGSLIIVGGSNNALFMNNAAANVPSYEYYPPRNFGGYNGVPIPSPLLTSSLNANLFPIMFYLPLSGRLFIAANTKSWMYDIQGNYEIALPDLPNGVRVTYPMAGTGVMLPLSPENGYVPTILICGGSSGSDTVAANQLNAQDPASRQCSRLEFTNAGLRAGWQVELMPEARIMPDAVMLPDGRLLILNGGTTGYSGYGNVAGQQGTSNAANPTMRPVIYDPTAPVGQRFITAGLPTSNIPRLYHSAATLLPSGAVAITGSNPNGDYTTRQPFPTEYRLEILSPPYMTQPRPTYTGLPAKANYGAAFTLAVTLPPNTQTVKACIMDYGFSTHSIHMDQRHVWLVTSVVNATHISVTMPPNFTIFPPGPAWLHVLADNIPSTGTRMLVGTGVSPRTDVAAWENMLNKTGNPT